MIFVASEERRKTNRIQIARYILEEKNPSNACRRFGCYKLLSTESQPEF